MHSALNNIIGRQHCMRVTRYPTPSATGLDLSLLLDGPLNIQGTYKIHDWTTFARVTKNYAAYHRLGTLLQI
jgi:hypothetical protein